MARKCWAKETYEKLTPYLQIGGYIIMLGTLVIAAYKICIFIEHTQGYDERLNSVETKVSSIPAMAQEIHDLHDFVLGRPYADQR